MSQGEREAWSILELAQWGFERRAEAESRGFDWIVVSEIYRGASRISSRIENYDCVANFWIDLMREQRRAFVAFKRLRGGACARRDARSMHLRDFPTIWSLNLMDSYERHFDDLRARAIVQGAAMRAAARDVLDAWRQARGMPGLEDLALALELAHRDLAYCLAEDDDNVFALRQMLFAGDAVRTVDEAVAAAGEDRAA